MFQYERVMRIATGERTAANPGRAKKARAKQERQREEHSKTSGKTTNCKFVIVVLGISRRRFKL
jgi:hypothetical protein